MQTNKQGAIGSLDDMLAVLEKPALSDTVKLTIWRNSQTRRLSGVLTATE